jgi:PBP1b-binding outer membrane lipoprotein LpoB
MKGQTKMKMTMPALLGALLVAGCSPVRYQTPPVVTDVRMVQNRVVVEKCILETSENPVLPKFEKVECKETELGPVPAR